MAAWEDDEDPWGEDPDWLNDDAEGGLLGGDSKDPDALGAVAGGIVGAQHVLLLIDCQKSMFDDIENSDAEKLLTPIDLALNLANSLLRKKIHTTVTLKNGKRDGVGVVLFNTKVRKAIVKEEGKDTDSDSDNDENILARDGSTVHVVHQLGPPGIKSIDTIRDFLEDDPVFGRNRDIKAEYGGIQDGGSSAQGVPSLQTALHESLRAFAVAKCVKNNPTRSEPKDTKSIWILTNSTSPYSDENAHALIKNIAADVHEQNVQILVWPLSSAGEIEGVFDYSCFYHDIVSSTDQLPDRLASLEDIEDNLEDLAIAWKRPRRTYWCPMILPDHKSRPEDEPNITIDWYSMVQLQKKPSSVKIDQETQRETMRVTQYVDGDGQIFATFKKSATVEERAQPQPGLQRIRQFAPFGEDLLPFPQADMTTIKRASNVTPDYSSLVILGFKDSMSIPFHHVTSTGYFICPNDSITKGSQQAFAHLHSSMLRKNVIAIGEVLHRITFQSRLCAIFPLEQIVEANEDDDTFKQKRPAGMLVTHLPFEDWMRDLELDGAMREFLQKVDNNLVVDEMTPKHEASSSELLMKSTKQEPGVDEDDTCNNGCIASEEAILAAVDLVGRQTLEDSELGEDFENAGLADFFNYLESVALNKPIEEDEEPDYDIRIDDSVVLQAASDQIHAFANALPEDVVKNTAKAKRKVATVEDSSGIDWQLALENDELGSYNSKQLQQYLRSVGERVSGRKADLIARVTNSLQESAQQSNTVTKKKIKNEDEIEI